MHCNALATVLQARGLRATFQRCLDVGIY